MFQTLMTTFPFLMVDFLGHPVWQWSLFASIVITLLVLDLGVFHKTDKEMGVTESLWFSAFYIAIACMFGTWVWYEMGAKTGGDFFTGFFVEKTLSIDNIFVIGLIFTYFQIPRKYQYRALVWGILAAIVFRGIAIAACAAIVQQFNWVMYLFALFLIATGVKMFFKQDEEHDISKNYAVRFCKKYMRVTDEMHGNKFFIRKIDLNTGKMAMFATPLFLSLVVINIADIVFAVDSVPAIFAITTDTFIVYTSNIFAILGLRALYFALSAMVHRFEYLKYALAAVLIWIGMKIFIADIWMKVPSLISLAITLGILVSGILFSLWKTSNNKPAAH
jgi:tellurite resistance protein TerC